MSENTQAIISQGGAHDVAPLLRYSDEQVGVIKSAICPAGITDSEFALFMEQCKRSGLDPLIKQMFCVPRNKKIRGPRGDDVWLTVHEAQPAEAGMLARAATFPDFRGIQAAAVYAQDKIEIDAANGTVAHTFNPVSTNRGALMGAWARIERVGCTPTVSWVRLSERKDERNPMWKSDGKQETLIVKCARVAVLRVVYPQRFGGLYTAEEMVADEGEPRNVTPAPQTVAERVAVRHIARPKAVAPAIAAPAAAEAPKPPDDAVDAEFTDAHASGPQDEAPNEPPHDDAADGDMIATVKADILKLSDQLLAYGPGTLKMWLARTKPHGLKTPVEMNACASLDTLIAVRDEIATYAEQLSKGAK